MKKYILSLLISLVSIYAVANDDLKQANNLYQKGDYAGAIKIYESIEKQNLEASELYFNLGNAYYKTNNTAKAILYFEKAHKLSPEDDDIDFNLKLANLKVVDKVQPIPVIFYTRWLNNIADMFSSTKWAVFSIIILIAALTSVVLFFISKTSTTKRISFFAAIVLLAVFTATYIFAGMQQSLQYNSNNAIVFAQSVYVKSSPTDKSTDLFILHEGTKVEILDTVGEWKKIKLANGNIGWIPAKEIEAI
jgi:tetratricopeptide (TPR) repeat protein